jgi:hypothetical protein
MTTAKQKANRERFKKVMAEAKKLRAKNSKLSQAEAVKKAWAISYNKKSNNVGAAKKASAKKVTSAKIKSALALAKKIKAKVKKVGAIKILEKGETKSTKPKAYYLQQRTKTGTFKGIKRIGARPDLHKDTKSHNVNIRVVSGIKQVFAIPSGLTRKQTENEIELLTNSLKWNKAFLKSSLKPIDKKVLRAKIKHINGTIKALKTYLRSLK